MISFIKQVIKEKRYNNELTLKDELEEKITFHNDFQINLKNK